MSQDPASPFGAVAEPKPELRQELQYLRMYRYVFENPNWATNFGWSMLALASQAIIPFVGNFVLLGYLYEMVESLHRNPHRMYPDFDINRFTDYLSRGIWPFLVSLIVSIPMAGVFMMCYFGGMIGTIVAVESESEAVQMGMAILIPVVILLVFGLVLLLNMITVPFMLQAGLARNLSTDGGLCFRRVRQFMKLTWKELLLGSLFLSVTAIPLFFAGLACCYVGVFAVGPWITFAGTHMQYQLYEIFLARGGEPIPLPQPPQPPQFVTADLA